jgi:hypothetical protein
VNEASLTYYAKRANWESGDQLIVEASTNGTTWTTLRTHTTSSGAGTSYGQIIDDLTAFAGQSTVYIRFRGNMTANDVNDQFYIDTVSITSGASSNAGYINGPNQSTSCGATVKRQRQLNLLTWEMAKAIEADGIEIFVVAFGVCQSNATIYTDAQCDAQMLDTANENTSDQRLLKCVASSKVGTNDHYYYAATASSLPSIFTQIAKQIAHRLVE